MSCYDPRARSRNLGGGAMTIEELVDPKSAALIVVDMQNDFIDPKGAIASHGGDPSMIQEMAPRLRKLLEAARSINLPIVHVRTHHSDWTDSESWLGRHGGQQFRI